jgi:hypothetical protein
VGKVRRERERERAEGNKYSKVLSINLAVPDPEY